jgi:hypothetical protein
MLDPTKAKPPKRGWNWFLWWRIDPDELDDQATEYKTMGIFTSARKLSACLLCLSTVVTIAFIVLRAVPQAAYGDAVIFAILAIFIYLGHRWAMIGAMIVWTIEKAFVAIAGIETGLPSSATSIVQLIWWALYMHAFYLAFRVEQHRRSIARAAE